MAFKNEEGDKFYPCVLFHYTNDEVEILTDEDFWVLLNIHLIYIKCLIKYLEFLYFFKQIIIYI